MAVPTTKTARQAAIREILATRGIRSQAELSDALGDRGLWNAQIAALPTYVDGRGLLRYWPDPNMPIPSGPFSARTFLTLSAMTSKASSQLTGSNSPFLSNCPFVLRISGVVSRSAPYMILDRK